MFVWVPMVSIKSLIFFCLFVSNPEKLFSVKGRLYKTCLCAPILITS